MTQANKISNSIKRMLLLSGLLATILLTGCALTPTVANIDIPSVANPTSGPVVKIVSVEDRRDFGPFVSGQCDQPSVDGDYHDKALTSRVFARQGCKYERANVMLPEGQTVASKFKDVVTNAFRLAGYQVVSDNSNVEATPVKVEVLKSWVAFHLDGMGMRLPSDQLINVEFSNKPNIQVAYSSNIYQVSGILGKGFAQVYGENLDELGKVLKARLEQKEAVQAYQ